MEAVRAFNNELSSLYETKPPVSRAKMASVTKSATKAIKFYKHVVQSVEKFILKCRPEYKVPGLYVIDSIVRQSRHQFGQDKDVFAPRFTKNITTTFQHLYKCPAEDKSKIVRVLNLWQKNGVFPSEVIQPLMDLAPDPSNPEAISAAQAAVQAAVSAREAAKQAKEQLRPNTAGGAADSLGGEEQNDVLKTVTDLLEQSQEVQSLTAQKQQLQQLQLLQQQLVQQTQLLQQPDTEQQPIIDSNLLSQIQTLANQLLNKSDDDKPSEPTFNKKLLDFDYGESDDDDDRDEQNQKPPGNHMPSHPALMLHPGVPPPGMPVMEQRPEQMGLIPQDHNRLHPGHMQHPPDMILPNTHLPPPNMVIEEPEQGEIEHEPLPVPPLMDGENTRDERDDRDRRRRRSRSRSRSPRRRRRSRSRSRDRRRRSRSRDRHRRSRERDRDREREKREKERERRKLGLPPVKENMLSVCSTTLWIGHLNKQTTEDDLRGELGNYGEIASMTLIPPRGCAYVSLTKRKDASRALDRLKGAKLLGNTLKAAWAMGTGIRESPFKENWDVDLGVVHIPWDKLSEVQLDRLAQGGMVDEDSLPEHLKTKIQNEENAQMEGRMDMQQHHMPNDIHQHQGPPPSMVPGMIPGQHMPGMMPVLPVGVMPPPIMGMPHIGVPPPGVVPSPLASLVPGMQLQQRPGLDLAAALATSSTTQPGLLVPPPSVVQAPSGGETPTEAEPPTSVKLVTQPGVSLGNPLQQAIQNLVNNSASISAVAQTGPGGLPQAVSIATGIRPPRLPFDQTLVQAALPRFALQPPDGLTPDAPPRPQGPIPGFQAMEGSPSTNHKQEGENRDLLGQAGQQQAGPPQIQSLLGPRLGLPPGDAGARPQGLAAVKLHAPPNDRLPRPGMDRPNGDPAGPDGPPGLPGSPMHRFAAPFGGPMGMRGPPGMGPPMRLRFRGLEPNLGMRPRFNRGHFAPELRMDFVRFGPGGPRPRGGDFRRGGPGRGRDFRPPFMGRRHPGDIDDHLAHNADENSDSGNPPGAQDDGPVD